MVNVPGPLVFRLALLAAVALALVSPAQAQARTVRRTVAPPRSTLGKLLRTRTAVTIETQQRRREEAFRRHIEHLSGNSPVPLPPVTGEWTTERGTVQLRELGGGRVMLSRPGSWEPDRVYKTQATTTTLSLTGENIQLVNGHFRTMRESGTLAISADGNRLEGVIETFDDYTRPGKSAAGKLGEVAVRWRRKLDLSVPTSMAWRMAIYTAPERAAEEGRQAALRKKKQIEEQQRRIRDAEENKRKQQEQTDLEAALLDEEGAGPAIPDMPPLPSLPPPEAPPPPPESGDELTGGEGGLDADLVRRYFTETVPPIAQALGAIGAARRELGPNAKMNPAAAAVVIRTKLVPAIDQLRDAANVQTPPGELGQIHAILMDAVAANNELQSALTSGRPQSSIMPKMQALSQTAKAKIGEYRQALARIGATVGLEAPDLGGP